MLRQQHGDFSFEPPQSWKERPILIYVAKDPQGVGASNIVVSRERREPGHGLREHVIKWMRHFGGPLKNFKLRDLAQLRVGNRDAVKTLAQWTTDKGEIAQATAFIDVHEPGEVLTVTCTAKPNADLTCWVEFDKLLMSGRFADEEPAAAPTTRELAPIAVDVPYVPIPRSSR